MSMYHFLIVKTIDCLNILTFKWHVHKCNILFYNIMYILKSMLHKCWMHYIPVKVKWLNRQVKMMVSFLEDGKQKKAISLSYQYLL